VTLFRLVVFSGSRYTPRTMIALRTALPKPALREFVRVFAQREVHPFESGALFVFEPIPARLEQMLEFQFGVPYSVHHLAGYELTTPRQAIIGAQVGSSQIELRPGVISFGIFFRPAGLSRLFGIPLHEITHRSYDAASVSNPIISIRDRAAECVTFEERVRVIEGFLIEMAARAAGKETMLAVAERVFSLRGVVSSVSELAGKTGLGVRQFERQFLRTVGMPPKLYARIARFQSALDMKIASPERAWAEIAQSLRYHDQMHMIRDFQLLGGDTPRQLLSQIGDARPGALEPESSPEKIVS
jgi:AraC-like DNA-binding protein